MPILPQPPRPLEVAIRHFYYGWVIVAVGTIATGVGAFAATTPYSAFLTPMSRDLGWSQTTLNSAQAVGTLLGGLSAPFAGRLIDRYGARLLLTAAGLGMGLSLLACAAVQEPWQFTVSYGIARTMFQGIILVATTTAVANWFVRRRGRATGLALMGNAISVALVVPLIQYLADTASWRVAWAVLGGIALLCLTPAAAIFLRRRPEDVGLLPDGDPPPPPAAAPAPVSPSASDPSHPPRAPTPAVHPFAAAGELRASPPAPGPTMSATVPTAPATPAEPDLPDAPAPSTAPATPAADPRQRPAPAPREPLWSLHAALRTPTFWLLLATGSLTSFTVAGVTTHQIPVLLHNGVPPGTAAAMVSVYAICWALGIVAWGLVADRIPARYGLAAISVTCAVASLQLVGAHTALDALIFALLFGAVVGGNSTLEALIWADYYGRLRLGTIRGFGRPFVLAANALGPLGAGILVDNLGSYQVPYITFAALSLAAALLILLARRPTPPPRLTTS